LTIIDPNLLPYAYNADAPQQRMAAEWLAKLLKSSETIAIIAEWLAQPDVIPLNPGPLHAQILEKLVSGRGATGPLVTDAVMAAIAIEYGAVLASTDQAFRRFPDLRWLNPLSA
jgi:uncharacterized protein